MRLDTYVQPGSSLGAQCDTIGPEVVGQLLGIRHALITTLPFEARNSERKTWDPNPSWRKLSKSTVAMHISATVSIYIYIYIYIYIDTYAYVCVYLSA